MKNKNNIIRFIVYISEIIFFIIFLILLKNQVLIKWIFIFLAGFLLSPLFGRFYCGWICPINTIFKPIDFVYRKMKIDRLRTPSFLKSKIIRFIFLFSFILLFIITKILKIKLNILLYVIGLATLITLFFEEELWHKHLCPYGSMLSIASKKSLKRLNIDEKKCIGCGMCQKICPTNTIITLDSKKRKILSSECLMCFECQKICPTNAITLKNTIKVHVK
ncbi:4Fe-4S binding protein [Marinitoga sp. 1197]|uniref:4Fe-4S binding protein n=1 Tax=Marinitoga sp. 1197 TaxID=1428449 RepID=UPI00064144C6|nr:4Fe-4S binding protein [Marinitoga sp. 1197]